MWHIQVSREEVHFDSLKKRGNDDGRMIRSTTSPLAATERVSHRSHTAKISMWGRPSLGPQHGAATLGRPQNYSHEIPHCFGLPSRLGTRSPSIPNLTPFSKPIPTRCLRKSPISRRYDLPYLRSIAPDHPLTIIQQFIEICRRKDASCMFSTEFE